MIPRWAACLVGALACYLLAILAAPLLPAGAAIVGTILYILAIILLIVGLILLVLWLIGYSRSRGAV